MFTTFPVEPKLIVNSSVTLLFFSSLAVLFAQPGANDDSRGKESGDPPPAQINASIRVLIALEISLFFLQFRAHAQQKKHTTLVAKH